MWETELDWDSWRKQWVCTYCGGQPGIKYIATGHDHTDYHYDLCVCKGAQMNGKHEDECN